MRVPATISVLIALLAASTVLAQGGAAPPTRVCEIGSYQCPNHTQIRATWPARCPRCGTVLAAIRGGGMAAAGGAGRAQGQVQPPGGGLRSGARSFGENRGLREGQEGFGEGREGFGEEREGEFGARGFRNREFGEGEFGDEFGEEFPDKGFGERGFENRRFGERRFPNEEFGEGEFGDEGFLNPEFGEREFGNEEFNNGTIVGRRP